MLSDEKPISFHVNVEITPDDVAENLTPLEVVEFIKDLVDGLRPEVTVLLTKHFVAEFAEVDASLRELSDEELAARLTWDEDCDAQADG